ncbi:MAG: ArsA family ATPase [Chloroflexi bacterium]|nr:ArsA family ATPase [Chloroflexota bacterium]
MRIIVHTGKGGVGKTSVSAATALKAADLGYRSLVVSTDNAHSLGDALQQDLGPEPVRVTDNLDAQELDVNYSIDKYWGKFQKFMMGIFFRSGSADVIAEEVTILPGLEEGASLLWLNEYAETEKYDVIVIDAAPTAETLRLLSLPDVARWWVERFLPWGRTVARIGDLVSSPFRGGGDDTESVRMSEAYETIQKLFDTLDDVRAMLADREISTMRLVVNAERMVIKETQRTYTYLSLYGYPVDAVIANRILPDTVSDPYFQAWKDSQKQHMQLIHEVFDPLPLKTAPLFPNEMGGLDLLRRMANEIYGDDDPTEHFFTGPNQTLDQEEDGTYVMTLPLPLADKSKLDLYRSSDELTLLVGNYKRNIVLPRTVWHRELESAKMDSGLLVLRFAATES